MIWKLRRDAYKTRTQKIWSLKVS